jgi:hypothetical protein
MAVKDWPKVVIIVLNWNGWQVGLGGGCAI